MSKAKEKAKKSSQLVLRIEKHEKDRFIAACEAIDSSAGREIRRFMREFVEAQSAKPDTQSSEATEAPEEPEVVAAPEPVAAPAEPETVEAVAAPKAKPAKKTKK